MIENLVTLLTESPAVKLLATMAVLVSIVVFVDWYINRELERIHLDDLDDGPGQ